MRSMIATILIVVLPMLLGLLYLGIKMVRAVHQEQARCPVCRGDTTTLSPAEELLLCHFHYTRLRQLRRDGGEEGVIWPN